MERTPRFSQNYSALGTKAQDYRDNSSFRNDKMGNFGETAIRRETHAECPQVLDCFQKLLEFACPIWMPTAEWWAVIDDVAHRPGYAFFV